ncbi:leukocyte immunoglobulin-like receptor subfamily A member 6 [Macrotis lagotis]|uniref:leukocyte immunoglobulin-like receptor subfamily A member 6 n=1 Tax=Macrotis lagotis TaxID=92651 RepID=UPI003D69FD94
MPWSTLSLWTGTILTPILSTLLSLGPCLDQRMWTQADTMQKFFLRANSGSLVPAGRNVTLRCQGALGVDVYLLKKQEFGSIVMKEKKSGLKAEFLIPSVTANNSGTYSCYFEFSTGWTAESAPLELVVSALPNSQVAPGQNVILQCQSEGWYDSAALHKDGEHVAYGRAQAHGGQSQTNFSILPATPTHGGTYQCYTFHSDFPQKWSAPSDPLVLRVTDSASQDYTVSNLICFSLAGLVLIILLVLLAEAWQSRRESWKASSERQPERLRAQQTLVTSSASVCLIMPWSTLSLWTGTILTPILSTLLSLGPCLDQRMWTQADTMQKFFLRADSGPLVPAGRNVTLRCQGALGVDVYLLKKQEFGSIVMKEKKSGLKAEFLIPSVTANDSGTYSCYFEFSTGWTAESAPLELVVSGLYDPPSLSALPSSQVAPGQNVILQCQSKGWYDSAALHKDGEHVAYGRAQAHGGGSQTNFSILPVTPTHGGTYQCYTFQSDFPQKWSAPSDPLVLRVTGLSSLQDVILMGIIAFLILLFLFLLLCFRCRRHQVRLRTEGGAAEVKKTTGSSDSTRTSLETLYVNVKKDGQTEKARPEDPIAPPREDFQDVSYAQLNLKSLKVEGEDFPCSELRESSDYAALK